MGYYKDLREHVAALEANDKLVRIKRPIIKETELMPLVRWQFRGLPEEMRKAFLFGKLTRRDYHAVPQVIGRKKELAAVFARNWRRHVGPAKLIYTRNLEGRKALLRARAHSMASAFQKRSKRISCWK